MRYKFLEHTADIKFQAFGKTIEEAFENSVLALKNSIYDKKIQNKKKINIEVSGKDFESLLYNFLEEFLFLFDSERFILSEIKSIKINQKKFKLKAEVLGDSSENYNISTHIKAVTYNEMFVCKEKGKWAVQVVLDV